MKFYILAAAALLSFSTAHAQERTASGAAEAQMTWSALSGLAEAAGQKADAVNVRVDQVVICGKKGMVYAPEQSGSDTQGCHAASNDDVEKILACNAAGKLWNGTSCIDATSTLLNNMYNCSRSNMFWNGTSCVGTNVPRGTACGASSHSTETGRQLVFACDGHDPKFSCPAGYSSNTAQIWGGKNGQSISYCFKN